MLVIATLNFLRRPAPPATEHLDDPGAEDTELDTPSFERETGEWRSGLRRVYLRPLEFSAVLPSRPGFYLIRQPGAERIAWKVVDVWPGAHGQLRAGWTDIEYRPLADLAGWEFCPIQEPRP